MVINRIPYFQKDSLAFQKEIKKIKPELIYKVTILKCNKTIDHHTAGRCNIIFINYATLLNDKEIKLRLKKSKNISKKRTISIKLNNEIIDFQ